MGNVLTGRQIQELDRRAIEEYGVPSLVLMENAGRAVAGEVLSALQHGGGKRVCIVCGAGNNAGDGFVAVRHLWSAGVAPDVVLVGKAGRLKNDAAVNFFILKKCRYPVREAVGVDAAVRSMLKKAEVIVDAVFGVGLNRAIVSPFREFIEAVNAAGRRVIAVDIPSGLDATTGQVYGVCVKAATTVTLTCAKQGFFCNEGPGLVGKVKIADIGIPRRLIGKI